MEWSGVRTFYGENGEVGHKSNARLGRFAIGMRSMQNFML